MHWNVIQKLFLTGIAVLFLATGTTQARPVGSLQCGSLTLNYASEKYYLTIEEREERVKAGREIGTVFHDAKTGRWIPEHSRRFRLRADGTLFYRGKRCEELQEKLP